MKIYFYILIMLVLAVSVNAKEMRAVYVTGWTNGCLSKNEIDKTISSAKKAKLTDIFVQVRKTDDATYNSAFVPKSEHMKEDFDSLDYIIKKAKKNNIKIHAWFVINRIGMAKENKDIDFKNMSWLNKDIDGNYISSGNYFLDPSNEEARKYIVDVIKEVVENYNIDGVHLDYIRYPKATFGYSENSKELYTFETGKTKIKNNAFNYFRLNQINKLVCDIRKGVKEIKDIPISASICCWGTPTGNKFKTAYQDVFQDYETWLDNEWIDYLMPMIYDIDHIKEQAQLYNQWLDIFSKYKSRTIPAIGGYLNKPEGIKNQINVARNKGFDGWIIFSFNEGEYRENILTALK